MTLPKYPAEVIQNTDIQTSPPLERSPENLVKLILQLVLTDPRYQIDRFGTKCNFFVHDFVWVMGYKWPHLVANSIAANLDKLPVVHHPEFGAWQRMVWQDAVKNANLGCPTIGYLESPQGHGHVVVVLPQVPPTNAGDVLIAQAGKSNFYGRQLRWAWKELDIPRVKFAGAP